MLRTSRTRVVVGEGILELDELFTTSVHPNVALGTGHILGFLGISVKDFPWAPNFARFPSWCHISVKTPVLCVHC